MLPEIRTVVPGPQSQALAARLRKCESRNVTYCDGEFPIFWQRASGTNVWDADGNRFLDLTSAFAVSSFGHSEPDLVGALSNQAATLLHGMGDVHPTALKVELCERLSEITFGRWGAGEGRVWLGCSGTDAVEAALKTALLATGRRGVLTFEGAYHGLGYGALAAGAMSRFREPFAAQLADFGTVVPFGESGLEATGEALATGEVGAVLLEPVLGRGGKVVPGKRYLPALRELCDRHGALLVLDEIYTGLNRTGKLFACEHWDVVPDIICLGKALTGGFPLSACIGRAELMDAWPESDGEAIHTSTFLGHPAGCAMALASLEKHADPAVAGSVVERGEAIRTALADVGQVRGLGLMLGFELPGGSDGGEVVKAALGSGLITLPDGPGGRVLAITPPFTIADDEIAFVADWLRGQFG